MAWDGLPAEANSWEPVEHLNEAEHWEEILKDLEANLEQRAKVFSSPRSLLACLSLYFSEVCFRAYVLANFLAA